MKRLSEVTQGSNISVSGRAAWVQGDVRRDPIHGDEVRRVWFEGALGPQDLPADTPVEDRT